MEAILLYPVVEWHLFIPALVFVMMTELARPIWPMGDE
jgi:hypothetical protein